MSDEINWQNITVPTPILSVSNWEPKCNMVFCKDGKTVCTLDWSGPQMTFTGDVDESAKVFYENLANMFQKRLEQERAAEREACAVVCDAAHERFKELWNKFDYPDDEGRMNGASQCAAAIRARGQE